MKTELTSIHIESYSYNHVEYWSHSVKSINYWLLGKGTLYPNPMIAKTATNHQLGVF